MRLACLDGMRGVFSLSVVVYHIFLIFLPAAITGDPSVVHLDGQGEHILSRLPQFLYNGNSGVCVFFVLSGFVLSYRFWETREAALITSAALRRYIRLTVPALASVLLAYLLLKAGWMRNQDFFPVAHSLPIMEEIYRFPADIFGAWKNGCWDIYFAYSHSLSYNPVLWTMEIELKGSFLSFAFLSIFGRVRRRWGLYLVLALLSWKTYYLSFVLGVALSDLATSHEGKQLWCDLGKRTWVTWGGMIAGILLSSYVADGRHRIFQWMNVSLFNVMQADSEVFYHVLGAAFLVYAVLQSPAARHFLGAKPLTILGEHSFALYLVHIPIFCSLGGTVFLYFLGQGYGYGTSVFLAVVCSAPVIVLLSRWMHSYVERAGGILARKLEGCFRIP